MARFKLDGFIEAFAGIVEGMDAARDAAKPALTKAIETWAEHTKRDAVAELSRPTWLLSRSIDEKTLTYKGGAKIWAMAGFKFTDKNPRAPGYYGQYHEAGWAPNNRRPTAPPHFLRRAKEKNLDELKAQADAAMKGIEETIRERMNRG